MSLIDEMKVRLGRFVLLYIRSPRDRKFDEVGRCQACGRETRFTFNSWVIPDDQFSEVDDPAVPLAYRRRESLFCRSCCCSQRVRGIAEVLLGTFGDGCETLAQLVQQPAFRQLDVAEVNTIGSLGSLHTFLLQLPKLSFSEFRGPDRLGEMIDGIRNEDMCHLTYPDRSFDILMSSDTLEHVPDFRLALRESRRVLRPGGRHIFTVPINALRQNTFARAESGGDGAIVHLMPPLYHGRGGGPYRYLPVGSDLLTFTEFGRDLTDHIREAGFEPEIFRAGADQDATGASFVFSARVPESN